MSINGNAALIALLGLAIAAWAAMQTEVEARAQRALIGLLGVLLLIVGIAYL